jgi:hypothetical protein
VPNSNCSEQNGDSLFFPSGTAHYILYYEGVRMKDKDLYTWNWFEYWRVEASRQNRSVPRPDSGTARPAAAGRNSEAITTTTTWKGAGAPGACTDLASKSETAREGQKHDHACPRWLWTMQTHNSYDEKLHAADHQTRTRPAPAFTMLEPV